MLFSSSCKLGDAAKVLSLLVTVSCTAAQELPGAIVAAQKRLAGNALLERQCVEGWLAFTADLSGLGRPAGLGEALRHGVGGALC